MPVKAQNPVISPFLSPQIEWKDIWYPPQAMDGANTLQHESDEDWYFDVIEYKKNGVVAGYAAVGFAGDKDFRSFTVRDQANQIIPCQSFDNLGGSPNCEVFETTGDRLGFHRQVLVFYDLNGNVTSYLRYNVGDFFGIVQDASENFYLLGNARNAVPVDRADEINASDEPHIAGIPMRYNFGNIAGLDNFDPLNGFTCGPDLTAWKFNIVKTNVDGTVLWNNVYGLNTTIASAFKYSGTAKSAVIAGNDLLAVGVSAVFDASSVGDRVGKKFVARIKRSDGTLVWGINHRAAELVNGTNAASNGLLNSIYKFGNQYVISGHEFLGPLIAWPGTTKYNAIVSGINSSALNSIDFMLPALYKKATQVSPALTGLGLAPIQSQLNSSSTSAFIHNNKIYWMLMANNQKFFEAGSNICQNSYIVEMSQTGTVTKAVELGELRAYDMWFSGIPTSDGGIAIVSSRHSPVYFDTGTLPTRSLPALDFITYAPTTLGGALDAINGAGNCYPLDTDGSDFFKYISTCAYVAKFDANLNKQWDKLWDSSDNGPRYSFPGNLKQQECLYRIRQSSVDGGFVIVGNTSDNFDDSYIVKLGPDCGIEPFFGGGEYPPDYIADLTDGHYDITGTETWNSPKKVLGRISVKNGAKLTINSTLIEFANGSAFPSGIDVEPNGELIVDNTTLTGIAECAGFWNGLEAWGTSAQHQYKVNGFRHQGYINIRNNSVIEYAFDGVTNMNQQNAIGQRGGVIQAVNSTFKDCWRAAQFDEYQNKNVALTILRKDLSSFTRCDFTTTNDYPRASRAGRTQVSMWGTDGVDLIGCNFQNSQTQTNSVDRGYGVFTSSAIYVVSSFCDSPSINVDGSCPGPLYSSSMEGYYRAINATASGAGRPFLVHDVDFSANNAGVYMSGVHNAGITSSRFTMGDHGLTVNTEPFPEFINVGIRSENESTGYTIRGNFFTSAAGAGTTFGTAIHNSGQTFNLVDKNRFENLSFANTARGENRGFFNFDGLDYQCNVNVDNGRDFQTVLHPTISTDPSKKNGISTYQGGITQPVGNRFSAAGSTPTAKHFFVNAADPILYFHASPAQEIPTDYSIDFFPNLTAGYFASCVTGPFEEGFADGKSNTEETENYNEALLAYHSLVSAGDSEYLHAIASGTAASEDVDAFAALTAQSPYVSKRVIEAAINSGVLEQAQLTELMQANPVALRSLLASENAENMPLYMQMDAGMLYEAAQAIDARTMLEIELHEMGMNLHRATRDGYHALLADTAGYTTEALLAAANHQLGVSEHLNKLFAIHETGDAANLWAEYYSIPTTHSLSPGQAASWNLLQDYLALQQNAQEAGRDIAHLSAAELNELIAIAENTEGGKTAIWAANALCFHYGICKEAQGAPADDIAPKLAYVPSNGITTLANSIMNRATVFPNPSNGILNVLAPAERNIQRVDVFDISGRLLFQRMGGEAPLMRIEGLSVGIVFIRLSYKEGDAETLRAIILSK